MSLVADIEECLRRSKVEAHRTTPIPVSATEALVRDYGPLPSSIASVVERYGVVELFFGKGDFPEFNLAVCYKLQMDRVGADEYYLNAGYWIYGAAVYYRWCPQKRIYLPGIYGVRGSGLAKNYDSIEHWFAASLKKVRKQYGKAEWDEQLGMKGFKPSAEC